MSTVGDDDQSHGSKGPGSLSGESDFVDAGDTLMMHALKSLPRRGQKFVFKEGDVVYTAWINMNVYASPQLIAEVVCVLLSRVYLRVVEVLERADKTGKIIMWIRADCGWILATDGGENPYLLVINDTQEAETSWRLEEEKKQRLASAVASMLVRSYSLPRCIRLARSIMKHALSYYPETNLTKISDEIMENIMIILGGQTALTKQKIFEYVKAAAARQSNPKKAVIDISKEIFETISKRPTLWVKEDLNVIITEEAQRRNDKFVMAAAMGDTETFQQFLNNNHELTSLHSQLHYTALHAAAEFGKVEIINMLTKTGLSLDIRDPVRGQTALHYGGYAGRSEVAVALLEAGANREIACYNNIYPFQAADKQGHVECREILKFLPPVMTTMRTVDVTINSISLQWDMPVLDRSFYAKIREFQVICQCTEDLHPDTLKAIPDPIPVLTSSLACAFKRLVSACEYRCKIRCRSVSGWSDWCDWLPVKTRSYIPDTPASPEIRKITINALYLNWYKPIRSNGADIDHYEIEVHDHNTIEAIAQQTATLIAHHKEKALNKEQDIRSNNSEKSVKQESAVTNSTTEIIASPPSSPGNRSLGSRKKNSSDSLVAQQGGVSKMHRIVKHKDVVHLHKCLTGLEPGRLYRVRIRAHNAMGFSGWSKWTPPVAPQVGVILSSFANETKSVVLQWFEPILSEHHHIQFYELQLCKVLGPRAVNLHAQDYHELHHPEVFDDEDDIEKGAPVEDDDYFDDEYTLARKREAAAKAATKKKEKEARIAASRKRIKESTAAHLTRGGADAVEEGGMNEDFHTVASDITTNQYSLMHLKAGGRYVVRVRIKLLEEQHWMTWDHALRSETFSTPSSVPDPPFRVQPRRRTCRPKKEQLRPLSPESRQTRALLQQHGQIHSLIKSERNRDNNEEDDIFPMFEEAGMNSSQSNKKKKGNKNSKQNNHHHALTITSTNYSGYIDKDILLNKKQMKQEIFKLGIENDDDDSEEQSEDDKSLSWWQAQINANEAAIVSVESQLLSQSTNNVVGITTISTNNEQDSKSVVSAAHTSLVSIVPDIPILRKPNQHEPLSLAFYQNPHHPTALRQHQEQLAASLRLPTQPYDDTVVLPQDDTESQPSRFLTMHPTMGYTQDQDQQHNNPAFDMAEFLATTSMTTTSLTATLPYEREDSFFNGDDSQDNTIIGRAADGIATFQFTAPGITAQEEQDTQSFLTGEATNEDPTHIFTDLWDITHDCITITWTPGDSNGENLSGCEIQIAEIKTYDHQDVLCARDAFLGLHYDEKRQENLVAWSNPSSELLGDEVFRPSVEDMKELVWENVNNRGTFLGPSSFIVQNLTPGAVYSFRIRICNRIGWSAWSKASAMVATYPSVAPKPPQIILVKASFSILIWEEVQYKQNQLTTLENQLQICTVAQQQKQASKVVNLSSNFDYADAKNADADETKHTDEDEDWRMVSASRPLAKHEIESILSIAAKEYLGKNVSGAMIERLVEGRFYKVRVRVRTVVGWSPWSESSELFRTMS